MGIIKKRNITLLKVYNDKLESNINTGTTDYYFKCEKKKMISYKKTIY